VLFYVFSSRDRIEHKILWQWWNLPSTLTHTCPIFFSPQANLHRWAQIIFIVLYRKNRKRLMHLITNPLPPSDAVRKLKKYFRESFQFSIRHNSKNIQPPGNLKFRHFPKLKIAYLNGKNSSDFSLAKFHSKYYGLFWVKGIFLLWTRYFLSFLAAYISRLECLLKKKKKKKNMNPGIFQKF